MTYIHTPLFALSSSANLCEHRLKSPMKVGSDLHTCIFAIHPLYGGLTKNILCHLWLLSYAEPKLVPSIQPDFPKLVPSIQPDFPKLVPGIQPDFPKLVPSNAYSQTFQLSLSVFGHCETGWINSWKLLILSNLPYMYIQYITDKCVGGRKN